MLLFDTFDNFLDIQSKHMKYSKASNDCWFMPMILSWKLCSFRTMHVSPYSIRGQYGLTDTRNSTHGSGKKQYNHIFIIGEILIKIDNDIIMILRPARSCWISISSEFALPLDEKSNLILSYDHPQRMLMMVFFQNWYSVIYFIKCSVCACVK